jgi:hypothetical protein
MALGWDGTFLIMKQKKLGKGNDIPKIMALSWVETILLMKQKKLGKRNDIQKINGIDLG